MSLSGLRGALVRAGRALRADRSRLAGADGMSAGFAALIATVIVVGLAVDALGRGWSQPLVNVVAGMLYLALLARSDRTERIVLLACLGFATAGEVFLALVWQIYDYRLGNLPWFVPPGHALLYALGTWVARRLRPVPVSAVCAVVAIAAIALAVDGRDQLSLALAALFVLCMRYGAAPQLYATMFLLALSMELWGTFLGNWVWRSETPWLHWTALNPPFAAGAFYCVLDWLVNLVRRMQLVRPADARAG